MDVNLKNARARWTGWLGQICRADKQNWVKLLGSNWQNWAKTVKDKHLPEGEYSIGKNRSDIKCLFASAIRVADVDDFGQLDELYAQDKLGLL